MLKGSNIISKSLFFKTSAKDSFESTFTSVLIPILSRLLFIKFAASSSSFTFGVVILKVICSPVVYFPENQMQQELQYWVAQVYIPKAFPLYLLERYGTFDSSRLLDFAHSCGKDSFNLNPMPHMFS
jgi:hypothetical protein